jgi:hypothetical protein
LRVPLSPLPRERRSIPDRMAFAVSLPRPSPALLRRGSRRRPHRAARANPCLASLTHPPVCMDPHGRPCEHGVQDGLG